MSREGGINFTSKRPGGYRQNADAMVTIDACQLLSAIENGLNFFHNEYSGLVFGVGKRKGDGNWDLEIPISFFFQFHPCRSRKWCLSRMWLKIRATSSLVRRYN